MEKVYQNNHSKAEIKARKEILEFLSRGLGKNYKEEYIFIEYPPEPEMGDYTVSFFRVAKESGLNPQEMAKNMAELFETEIAVKKDGRIIAHAKGVGPYLNFMNDAKRFADNVVQEILGEGEKYGYSDMGHGKKIMIEYFSPNTNKPLTIGHVRNICLGYSVSRIYKILGYGVIEATLYNDRGIAISKAMAAYLKWGDKASPRSENIKGDHFVGKYYVMFGEKLVDDPSMEEAAKDILIKWEKGDKKVIQLWKKMMGWVLDGFSTTLKSLSIHGFDVEYYESKIYTKGKEIILKGLGDGIFKKHPEGYIYAPLEQYGMPDKILLRSDGTSLYIVQDIYLSILKSKKNLEQSIYVVGSEQDLALRQLFKILEMLGYHLKNIHLSYGMIRLPDGKIKSREGIKHGTGADELIENLENSALEEVKKRNGDVSKKKAGEISRIIALGALKYYILNVNAKTIVVFDPEKSLSFVGNTGPYLQYVHARISSILKKSKVKISRRAEFSSLRTKEEKYLVQHLSKFPSYIQRAAEKFDPSAITLYLYELARHFSIFYENVPILKVEGKLFSDRIALITAVKQVMACGLKILGIDAPEKM